MGIFGIGSSENLYFTGCYSYAFLRDKAENYEKILKKLGINFLSVDRFICCGGFLEEAGYEKQLRKKARENMDYFYQKGIKKIITSCPLCTKTLMMDYKSMLPDWKIESESIIITILRELIKNPKLVKIQFYEPILYLDSCCLSRSLNITEEPREILRCLGFEVLDMPENREESLCEGSCSSLRHINPELSKNICKSYVKKILREAKKKKIRKIVTADPRQYQGIAALFDELGIKEPEIFELSDIICHSLRIKRS
jgi:Fe-S oxidoreductase